MFNRSRFEKFCVQSLYRYLVAFAFSITALFASASAHALFIQVNSARIIDNEIEMVISTDVTHSCFTMETTAGQTRSLSTICVSGNQQVYTAPRSLFPELQIGDTLVLKTVIAPGVQSPSFRFTGDLSLQSVRLIGGTLVEVVYSLRFPACAIMFEGQSNNISRTSNAFCAMGENVTVLLDREVHFTNIQSGQSVKLSPITRPDLITNSVTVGSAPSPLPCVLSSGGLTLMDRAAIVSAKVYAESVINLGSDSAITGNLLGRDDLNMDWRAKVSGNVSLIGTLELDRGTISGMLSENVPVVQQLLDDSLVAYSTPNHTVQYDQSLTLAPGRYGNVTVLDRGRLRLSAAGAYSFLNLTFSSDAKLELNTSQGDFNVEAMNLVFGQRFVMIPVGGGSVDGSKVVFYSNANTMTVPHDSVVRGHIWAPNANLTLQDRAKVQGCVRAANISVGMDGRILQN
jgi:hypothetical protein